MLFGLDIAEVDFLGLSLAFFLLGLLLLLLEVARDLVPDFVAAITSSKAFTADFFEWAFCETFLDVVDLGVLAGVAVYLIRSILSA